MTIDEIRSFVHSHLKTLELIAINLEPLTGDLDLEDINNNDTVFHFKNASPAISKLLNSATTLLNTMQETGRNIDFQKQEKFKKMVEMLNEYLKSTEKFTPAYLFDELNNFKPVLATLKRDAIAKEAVKNIEHDIRFVNSFLGEYFLYEAVSRLNEAVNAVGKLGEILVSDTTDLIFEEINIVEVLEEVLQKFKPICDRKKLEISRTYTAGRVYKVWADRVSVLNIFSNLIENAIKYNFVLKNYRTWLSVRIKNNIDEKFLVVEIESWGPKIDQDEIDNEYIFELNYRGKHTQGLEIKGTGLGLFQVKRLLKKIDGMVHVKSVKKGERINDGFTNTFAVSLLKSKPSS